MRHKRHVLTGTGITARLAQWTQRSVIKSIQRGTVTIGTGATSATATITAVDLTNSRLRFLSYSNSGNAAAVTEDNCYIELTNATTVTATHTTAGNTIIASFEVIEYWPGVIRSVQRGLITITNGNSSATATITAVVELKTELDNLGFAYTGTASADYRARIALTNATTVTATRAGSTDAITQSYQAVQWW